VAPASASLKPSMQTNSLSLVRLRANWKKKQPSSEPLVFLEMFRSDRYADISLNPVARADPPELMQAHLNLDDATTTTVAAYNERQADHRQVGVALGATKALPRAKGPARWAGPQLQLPLSTVDPPC
jgi:hypothetical protein